MAGVAFRFLTVATDSGAVDYLSLLFRLEAGQHTTPGRLSSRSVAHAPRHASTFALLLRLCLRRLKPDPQDFLPPGHELAPDGCAEVTPVEMMAACERTAHNMLTAA